jgi:Flp pilus assembly protein TadD
LRAGLAFAERRAADIDPAIARAQAVNPQSAEPNRAVAEVAARKYHFDDAVAYAQKAVLIDGEDEAARFDLGLSLLRTGDEARARGELDAAWNLSETNDVLAENLLTVLDHLDTFVVVPDGDLIFKFPPKEAALLKPYAMPLAEEAYKTYVARYGFTPKGPILIEIFWKHDDFAVRTVGEEGITGALGACFGRVVTMDSPSARPPGSFSWQATLWHEMAHVFTLQLSKYNVPRWLTEGLSVYEEYKRNPAWGREITLEYARALEEHKTFGFKGLAQGFKDPARLSLAYFEASIVVEHLENLGGDQAVRTLLQAYADGATDAEAFSKAFGKNLDDIETGYNAFVEKQYGALRDALKDPPKQVAKDDLAGLKDLAASAPGNFTAQMAYAGALLQANQFDEARAPLERAAALAPPTMGEGSPHALLAAIAQRDGDFPRARQELRALLKFDHTNVEAARVLASFARDAHADGDLDFALRLIADVDPFDIKAHTELGHRMLQHGNLAGAVTEFTAALALSPVNLAEAHTDLGEALLAVGRKDDAKKEVLAALQLAPNYARAQDLLLAILGKDQRR